MVRGLLVLFLLGQVALSGLCASNISCESVKSGRVVANVVTVNLADPETRVSVALAKNGTGHCESFKSIVKRVRPVAAITGTFFDTKTFIPTGDIALFGSVVHSGCIGSALCIDANNKASIVPLATGRKTHWGGYETVLCAGPTLVSGGTVSINLKREGFHNTLCAPTQRTALGITKSGKLLMVATNKKTSLKGIARLMIKLHAVDAVCLDGGSSTALYHAGRYLSSTSRPLTNCLVVYSSTKNYEAAKLALAPEKLFAQAEQKPVQHSTTLIANTPRQLDLGLQPTATLQYVSADLRGISMTHALASSSAYGSNSTFFPVRIQSQKWSISMRN